MNSHPTLTVLSLGGGVQSSVMALMASQGAFDRIPDCAIFADTHWEPPSVYEHIEWLAGQLRFPLHVVDNGRSLREDVKALTNHSGSRSYVDIPVYLKGRDGQGDGIGRRQCTTNYKIRPIRRRIRELLGLRPRQRVPAGTTVELWLGISTDEAMRMKDSRDRWMTNRYPLIEAGMSRSDCADWWATRYDRPLGRSACVACPFQSRQRWVEAKRRWPGCSPRRWRSTQTCEKGSPWTRPHTCTCFACPWPRPLRWTRRSWEPEGRRTGSGTSARDTVGCEQSGPTLPQDSGD